MEKELNELCDCGRDACEDGSCDNVDEWSWFSHLAPGGLHWDCTEKDENEATKT